MFGPTYLRLRDEENADPKPYHPLARGRHAAKGKQAVRFSDEHVVDDIFNEGMGAHSVGSGREPADDGRAEYELEKNWVLTYVGMSLFSYLFFSFVLQIMVIEAYNISQFSRRG